MTSKFFSSIGFSVCAFIFLVLIAIMYFTKRKQRKTHSNSFAFLIGITAFLLIMEVCYVYSMHNTNTNPMLIEILCRTYLIGAISWIASFAYYLIFSSISNYEAEEKDKQRKKYMIILSLIALGILKYFL